MSGKGMKYEGTLQNIESSGGAHAGLWAEIVNFENLEGERLKVRTVTGTV